MACLSIKVTLVREQLKIEPELIKGLQLVSFAQICDIGKIAGDFNNDFNNDFFI